METSQLICMANQLTDFNMMGRLPYNESSYHTLALYKTFQGVEKGLIGNEWVKSYILVYQQDICKFFISLSQSSKTDITLIYCNI